MNDRLKQIFDKIKLMSKDELLALAGFDAGAAPLNDADAAALLDMKGSISQLNIGDFNALLNALCDEWGIPIDTLAGTADGAGAEEEDSSSEGKLFDFVVTGLEDSSVKLKAVMFLKKVISTDPNWTMTHVKNGVDAVLQGTEFVIPVAYPDKSQEILTLREELKVNRILFKERERK